MATCLIGEWKGEERERGRESVRGGEHKGREGEKRMVGTMEKDGRRECNCERREGRKRKTEQERGMERRMK